MYFSILVILPILLYVCQIQGGFLAGSKEDWLSQHSVFPEYFRNLFYQTGSLFPQYSSELGGGQNIYNFAYYGLYNPLYMISYLLPFVSMTAYIQAVSLLEMIADGLLCYLWLGRHFKKPNSFLAALVLQLSLPVLFHSSNQLMFVNYMPFLILAFWGCDRYRRVNRYGLLVTGIFLMLLCSFYFAIGGVLALVVYVMAGIQWEKVSGHFVKYMWHTFYPFLLGGMLSLFYLFPVFCAMTTGRRSDRDISVMQLLLPNVSMTRFLYQPYGLGLTGMALVAFCVVLVGGQGIRKRRKLAYSECMFMAEKMAWMLAVIFCVPIFEWLLNGGLYIRDKVLIPFLPLVCWIVAVFLEHALPQEGEKDKPDIYKRKKLSLFLGVCMVFTIMLISLFRQGTKEEILAAGELQIPVHLVAFFVGMADMLVCIAALILYCRGYKMVLYVVTVGSMLLACGIEIPYMKGVLVTRHMEQQLADEEVIQLLNKTKSLGTSEYRMEVRGDSEFQKANLNRILVPGQRLTTCYSSILNPEYQLFRKELGLSQSTRNYLMQDSTMNPAFLRFMGVRYLVSSQPVAGYQKVAEEAQMGLYENAKTAPLMYLTNQTISKDIFDQLSWSEKQLELLQFAVISEKKNGASSSCNIKKEEELSFTKQVPITLYPSGDISIQSKQTIRQTFSISPGCKKGQYLFLAFQVKNRKKSQDISITINGECNKLSSEDAIYYNENETFHYTLAMTEDVGKITINFGPGDYQISNMETCIAMPDNSGSLYQIPLQEQMEQSGNAWSMDCETNQERWLITSLPYDDQFQIYVDGERTEIRKVNSAFLGANIKPGKHHIRIVYHAPGRNAGLLMTGITILILGWDKVRQFSTVFHNIRL